MEKKWQYRTFSSEEWEKINMLMEEMEISSILAQLYVARGLYTQDAIEQFLHPSLAALHDPFLMNDMQKAVDRLTKAVKGGENILLYGDYDVDGTTSVALAYRFLATVYDEKKLFYYVPDRYTEGYGVSAKGVDYAFLKGCRLVISLDCGIKENERIRYAKQKNIDFIVCDHHEPGEELPDAVAVLDCKRKDNTYPFPELSGCGVGFKLMYAYAMQHGISLDVFEDYFELLALSAVADIVPLVDENRIFAYYGLKQLNERPSVGLRHLIEKAALKNKPIEAYHIGFDLGPRINACGRIKTGMAAVQLLITDEEEYAEQMAQAIDQYNKDRKEKNEQIFKEACEMLAADKDNETRSTTVVFKEDWHQGVLGIVASHLTEIYYRPTIVFAATSGDIISGSARSVGSYDLYAAVCACEDLFTTFGGHTFAAGISMKKENFPIFKERFEQFVKSTILPQQQQPIISIESEIALNEINKNLYQSIRQLEPFGSRNKKPIFSTKNLVNYKNNTRLIGKQKEHLKVDLQDENGVEIRGVAFGKGEYFLEIAEGNPVDICYEIMENDFNNKTSLEIQVKDIHLHSK